MAIIFTADQIPTRLTSLVWQEMDDGLVLVSPEAGQMCVLNTVGMTIWQLLDGQHTVQDIEQELQEIHEQIPVTQLRDDLHTFLHELTQRELLVWR